jgi:hypothetical protein
MNPNDRQTIMAAIVREYPSQSAAAQRQRLAAALERLGSVTTFESMRKLDIYDPRPRKLELVKAGYLIGLSWDRVVTESGEVHRVGRYYLKAKPQEVTP